MEELCQQEFEKPLFLCDPLIPQSGIILLHGPSESGKTQVAMTLTKAILEGSSFLDQFPCRPGKVVLLEADTPMLAIQDRLRRFRKELLPALRPNFKLLIDETKSLDITKLSISPVEDVVLAQQFAPDLVIFDALRDLHPLDEIDSRTPRTVYGACRRLFPRAALLFIHHDRKKPTTGFRHPDEEASGSAAWRNASDVGLHLERFYDHKEPFSHFATLRSSKTRWSERVAPVRMQMHDETLLVKPTELSPSQLVAAWTREEPEIDERRIIARLLEDKKCSRATAYRVAKKAVSEQRKNAVSRGETVSRHETPQNDD